jgi:hypothetical protein
MAHAVEEKKSDDCVSRRGESPPSLAAERFRLYSPRSVSVFVRRGAFPSSFAAESLRLYSPRSVSIGSTDAARRAGT